MANRPDFYHLIELYRIPGWTVLGDDFVSPNTLPRGMIPVTGRGPWGLHSTYYLTSDTSPIIMHINSQLPPPTTA
ncbi:hypothetical protein TIFTF001_046516 [Ficus carica]|uniref:Uncharacterized protein n=1 Tax=Ficus carica TaxID=3494 RepID=A0AA87ZAL3_FICCA|nr:hypothetical protein TIFTF001_046516 [Ficus carica]